MYDDLFIDVMNCVYICALTHVCIAFYVCATIRCWCFQ